MATGVETAPGKKDAVKVREFVAAAQGAAERLRAADGSLAPTDGAIYNWEEDLLS